MSSIRSFTRDPSKHRAWIGGLLWLFSILAGNFVAAQDVPSVEEMRNQIQQDWSRHDLGGPFVRQGTESISAAMSTGSVAVGIDANSGSGISTNQPLANSTSTFQFADFGLSNVQLVRGDETYEISLAAFQQSGLFAEALQRSPTLRTNFTNLNQQAFEVKGWQQFQSMNQSLIEQAENQLEQLKAGGSGIDADLSDEQELRAQQDAVKNVISQQQLKATEIQQEISKAQTQLATAQTEFAISLQEIGFNGAQVAVVRKNPVNYSEVQATSQSAASEMMDQFVLLRANGKSTNNSGYSITRSRGVGQQGLTTVPSEYLLPTPANPDDLFYANSGSTQRLPDGLMVNLTNDAETNPIVRLIAAPHFGAFYDTGKAPAAGNFAQGVALDGRDNPAAGQSQFFQGQLGRSGGAETALDLIFDTQILNAGGYSMQVFADANNSSEFDQLDVEHFGLRLYNRTEGTRFEGWSAVIGKTNSLFSPADLRPTNIQFKDASLIGYGERPNNALAQLGLHIPINDAVKFRVALEEPYAEDLAFTGGTRAAIRGNQASTLTRWPTFSSNLEIGTNDSGLVLGGVVRSLGYQGITGEEFFDDAWGLSAIGRVKRGGRTFYLGMSGGNGIGDYIQGVTNSAVVGDASLNSLSAYGSFLGFQNTRRKSSGRLCDQLNVAYGYSWMETPDILGATVNQKLQQAWVNYQRQISNQFSIGFQYEYGYRQVAGGDLGDNNRFAVILSFRTGKTQSSTRLTAYNSAVAYVPPGGGLDGDLVNSLENVRTQVNGNSIQATVQQNQRGGAAFLQRF